MKASKLASYPRAIAKQLKTSHHALIAGNSAHLHSSFCQVDPQGQILPHENVRVVGLCKCSLQLLQLVAGESGPEPPLLAFAVALGVTLAAIALV